MKPLSLVCLGACLCICSLFPSTTHAQRLADSANACLLLKNPVNFPSVQRNALTIVTKSDEDCVLKFIDVLADSSLGRNHRQYLACLDALCRVSNGEIAKDLDGVCARLFHKNFNYLFDYIYKPNLRMNTQFEQVLIEGVGLELSASKDPAADKANLVTFLHAKQQEMKMNGQQKAYMESLKDKIIARVPAS
jgi:hypothetical protein